MQEPLIIGKDFEKVIVTSDHHLVPRDIKNIPNLDNGKLPSPFNWIHSDLLRPEEGILRVWNGDGLHTYPIFPWEKNLVSDALLHLTKLFVKYKVDGKKFRLIEGNHTNTDKWPTEIKQEWQERGIIVPNGKLAVLDPKHKITFNIEHGHEAQPIAMFPPYADSPTLQRITGNILQLGRKTGIVKEHVYPYASTDRALRFLNAAQAIYTKENYPDSLQMAVYGHSHVAGFYPQEGFINLGFRDSIHNWQPELTIDSNRIDFRQRNLSGNTSEQDYFRNNISLDSLAETLTSQAGRQLANPGFATIGD